MNTLAQPSPAPGADRAAARNTLPGRKLRVLSLFAGIGGFDYGLEKTGGFETVAFCEFADYPRHILAKHWPNVPCFPDVRELKGSDIDGPVDVICGGYPCQPFSTAGKRQGKEDDRHFWPEFMRLVVELRPSWVIGENVAGHISMGLDDVLADMEAEGYACRTFVIPACAVGASHRRDRVWTVANLNSERWQAVRGECEASTRKGLDRGNIGIRGINDAEWKIANGGARENPGDVAHAIGNDAQGQQPSGIDAQERAGQEQRQAGSRGDGGGRRGAESRMGRVADGLPNRLDGIGLDAFHAFSVPEPSERVKSGVKSRAHRLKALGNAVHPDIPMMIGHAILAAEAAS